MERLPRWHNGLVVLVLFVLGYFAWIASGVNRMPKPFQVIGQAEKKGAEK